MHSDNNRRICDIEVINMETRFGIFMQFLIQGTGGLLACTMFGGIAYGFGILMNEAPKILPGAVAGVFIGIGLFLCGIVGGVYYGYVYKFPNEKVSKARV